MLSDMMKKLFIYLPPTLFLLMLLFAGCAHKPMGSLKETPHDAATDRSTKTTPDKKDGLVSTPGAADNKEDEFFEEEFETRHVQVADPLYIWNKGMYYFNDKLYFWLLKPLAKGYRAITPDFVREGARNFFQNLMTPIRLVNCLLQGKGNEAGSELTKFFINTILGGLGFGNFASRYPELAVPDDEDFGQTLAKYGIGNGIYIVWPILGPSTLRDSIGMFGDGFLYPVNYVTPVEAELGIRALDSVNQTSFHIGEYEALKEASVDPYVAIRNSYLQYREQKVKQ
jgi:phospholipid-binding lipoprotein MlaA